MTRHRRNPQQHRRQGSVPPPAPVVVGVASARDLPAVRWAADEAARRDTSLLILRAVSSFSTAVSDGLVAHAVQMVVADGRVSVSHEVRLGAAHQVLLEAARRAQVLVLGARDPLSSTDLLRSALGLVVSHAPCPIVVVDEEVRGRGRLTGVLALADAEPSTAEVLEWAFAIADRDGLPLTVTHVARDLRPRERGGDDTADTLAWLDDDASSMSHRWNPSVTDGLVETAHRQHPTVLLSRVLSEVEARVLLADPDAVAEAVVVDAHHARRLLHLVARRGGNACLTVIVPSPDLAGPSLSTVLEGLVGAGLEPRGNPERAALATDDVAVPPVGERVLVPAREHDHEGVRVRFGELQESDGGLAGSNVPPDGDDLP